MTRRLRMLGLGAVLVALAAYLFIYDPSRAGLYPPCLFLLATGHPCPGCGTTRALHALLHGRVSHAISLSPQLPLLLLAAVGCALEQAPSPRTPTPRADPDCPASMGSRLTRPGAAEENESTIS